MKKWLGNIWKTIKAYHFVIVLFLLFLASNAVLYALKPVAKLSLFDKNDFEKTALLHNEKTWDKVFFGNSVVVCSFMEEESGSGYINAGLAYGKVSDVLGMLKKKDAEINKDLVLGLNNFTFMDELDTNPTYPWFRDPCEPYAYFERDRLQKFVSDGIDHLFDGKPFVVNYYTETQKLLVYGQLSDAVLDERIEKYKETSWNVDITGFSKNLAALEELIRYCEKHEIRLRAVWMPFNGYIEPPPIYREVQNAANTIFQTYGTEVLDMTDALPRECFHDLGHLNQEVGAPMFTKEIEQWLGK